jgi:3-oxoadipate enol-lactonase
MQAKFARMGMLFLSACVLVAGGLRSTGGATIGPQGSATGTKAREGRVAPATSSPIESEGYVPVEGGRLYYKEAGEGAPVILIHGGFLDQRMWDGQVPVFARSYRVVRYDVRSHGKSHSEEVPFSDVSDLSILMDSLSIDRANIVGLSLGGRIALDFALAHPERVRSLVLVGPGVSGFPYDEGSPELAKYLEELKEASDRGDFEGMIEVFRRYWCDGPKRTPEEVDPEVRSKVLEMLSGSLERWMRSPLEQAPDPPAYDRVADVEAATLIIVGTVDMPIVHRVAAYLEANIPGARRVDIPGVAHMVNMEAPERFNEVVLEFLAGQ